MKLQKLVFILLVPIFSLATITFERTYGTLSSHETGYAVQTTLDGGYAIVGCATTGRDIIYFVRTDSLGYPLWISSIGQPYRHKNSYSLKELDDGGFIIVGYKGNLSSSVNDDAYLVRFSSSGDTLWSKLLGGDSLDRGYWIEITPDSNFIIAGQTKSYGVGSSDVWLVKTDTSGNVLWHQTYGGTSYDMGRCIKNTPDCGFIIVGSTYSFGAGFRDIYLIKTDSLGNLLWSKTYGGSDYEWGYDVENTIDNGYIIVGSTNSFSFGVWGQDVYLIKTNSLGDTLWTKTYGGVNDDVGHSVTVTLDNGFVVAGYTESEGAGYSDVWLIKTDSLGNIIWTKTYGGVDNDGAYSIKTTQDNGFIITGYTDSNSSGKDVYLIKTDSLGNVGIKEKETSNFRSRVSMIEIFPSLVTRCLNIEYMLTRKEQVELSIYDATGSRVRLIKQEKLAPGYYQQKINIENLSNGVYFIVLKQGDEKVSKKFLLIK